MTTLGQVPEGVRCRIAEIWWNRIARKHEGPMSWARWVEDVEVFEIGGRSVLFPVPREGDCA